MYNTAKIEKLKTLIQSEIDEVIKRYEPLMNKAIKAQIPRNNKLYSGRGSVFCENSKGDEVGDRFSQCIQPLVYSDCFETGMDIDNVNV